jgi:hypothetical protein
VIRKLAVVVAAMSLLTGCAMTQQAGAAATIGDQRLTNEELTARYEHTMKALGDQSSPGTALDINRRLISSFVFSVTTTYVAQKLGVEVTDAEVETQYQALVSEYGSVEKLEAAAAAGASAPETIHMILKTSGNFDMIGKKLAPNDTTDVQGQKAVAALAEAAYKLNLQIAPRYGTWDNNAFTLTDDTTLSMTLAQMFPTQPAA